MPRRAGKPRKLLPAGRPAAGGKSLAASLAERLAEAIERGAVGVGELLPPERELAARHQLGRVTVRTALSRLVGIGLVESRPGVGHVVVRREALARDTQPVGLVYRELRAFGRGTSKSVPAIEAELASRGRALLIGSSGLNAGREDDCIRRFRSAGAGALVVAPATSGPRSAELEAWIRRGQPVVLEGHPGQWLLPEELAARCDQVDVDNRGGVRLAVEHLKSLGHRGVAYLTFGSGESSERLAGFLEATGDLGVESRREWVMTSVGDAARAVKLWRQHVMPGAVVCSDDDTALSFIRAARAGGLSCPGDVSVVGFGNESVDGPGALPKLTTVDHSRRDLAREIARLLENQPGDGRRRAARVRIPVNLLVRGSCTVPQMAGTAKRRS